jgi:hypothetical protein
MTAIHAHAVTADKTAPALAALAAEVSWSADMAFVFYGAGHDPAAIKTWMAARFPGVPYIGGSSCRGVLVAGRRPDPGDIAMLTIVDPDGDYGVGCAPLGDDPASAAQTALMRALAAAGSEGELPAALLVFQPPGLEERVVEGLHRVVGNRCPVLGGSTADDMMGGQWSEIAPDSTGAPSVVVAVLFPSTAIATTFQSGFAPTGRSGTVTAATGRRIDTIDGRPAALVYDEWLDGRLAAYLDTGGTVMAETSLNPLGIATRQVGGIEQHRLVLPSAITPGHGLETLAEIEAQTHIELMEGSTDGLARRAARALRDAQAGLPDPDRFTGALVVYCGACMMAIGSDIGTLVETVSDAAAGRSVLGVFTFGEQGHLGKTCVHGNLMVSTLAFAG